MSFDRDLAQKIDHTLLRPEATETQVVQRCVEAGTYGFASVCVNSSWVPVCVDRLADSDVKVCAVVGFPLGSMATEIKTAEAAWAVGQGASEIDMVLSVGRLLGGEDEAVQSDIAAVVGAAAGRTVKVILETGLLDEPQKILACEIARKAGAHFVKTSTGFGPGGATEKDVRLMRSVVGEAMGVKASGGIRDRAAALRMIAAGADRLGTSASVAIVTGD